MQKRKLKRKNIRKEIPLDIDRVSSTSKTITFKVSDHEYKIVELKAKRLGLHVYQFCRMKAVHGQGMYVELK